MSDDRYRTTYDDRRVAAAYVEKIELLQAEIERLRERLGPRGLEVIIIDGVGHYVNEKIKAEIERLRAALEEIAQYGGTHTWTFREIASRALGQSADGTSGQ